MRYLKHKSFAIIKFILAIIIAYAVIYTFFPSVIYKIKQEWHYFIRGTKTIKARVNNFYSEPHYKQKP